MEGGSLIGFIGGTGPEGRGLALRFALAGERVFIGSRDESRAQKAVESIARVAPSADIRGGLNGDVSGQADIVFVSIPYSAQRRSLEVVRGGLAGKIVVDVVAPMAVRNGVATAIAVAEGSAALEARAVLPESRLVSAFQTISAHDLLAHDNPVESDVVVCTDDPAARRVVMELAEKIEGVRAVNGGGIHNAGLVESIAPLLLNINRIYKARSGIRIVGI